MRTILLRSGAANGGLRGDRSVEGEEFFEQVVVGAEALGLQHEGIELFVALIELAGWFWGPPRSPPP